MSKVADFYAKAIAEPNIKAKLNTILNGKNILDATDEQLKEIGKLAKDLDFDISIDEAKVFLKNTEELSEDDLEKVAGGSSKDIIKSIPDRVDSHINNMNSKIDKMSNALNSLDL